MIAAEIERLLVDMKCEIERRWACQAALIQTVPVRATAPDNRTCDVDVHVFELADCAKTHTAYAWSSDSRLFTALDIGPIRSPVDAVCATLADEVRQRNLAMAGLVAA